MQMSTILVIHCDVSMFFTFTLIFSHYMMLWLMSSKLNRISAGVVFFFYLAV